MNDPIADMLTRVRNAQAVKLPEVFVPFSKMKQKIAEILKGEGFLNDVEVQEGPRGVKLRLLLKYHQGKGVIETLERVSKPGRRVYSRSSELPRILQGLGIAIISTSRGVMTDKNARQLKLGGEIICKVW
jgi:small subunit ribosomal protein S8